MNRVTRWAPDNYLKDLPGRYLYIRDEKSQDYWSSGARPVGKSEIFECRHGLGYTTVKNLYNNIQSEISFFVPQGESLEVWIVKLSNLSNKTRELKLFPFVEWSLGNWMPQLSVPNLYALVNHGWFDSKSQLLIARKFPWGGKEYPFIGYMGSSLKVKGYDVDLENFIGRYRDYSKPEVVEKGLTTRSEARGMYMVGVFEHELRLKPKEEKEFVVVLGLSPSKESEAAISSAVKKSSQKAKKYRNLSFAKKSFAQTKQFWKDAILSNNITIKTPNEDLNQSVNVWMKYQIYMNNHWGRSASYYHEGWGEFGYRNSSQDAWSMVPLNSNYAKEKLITLAKHQKKNGQPLPGWSLSLGPSTHKPPSDFPIWLPMLLIAYIKETGDFAILKKQVKYFDGTSATIYEHAKKATEFLQDIERSKRGIPLMGTQDWNDAFDRTGIRGKGESVWLGMGLMVALKNLEELADHIGDGKVARDCRSRYEKMKTILNRYAWDGEWYCYAFNDFGEPIGSRKNKEGKIQLNAQTWAIIAALPDEEKLKKILKVIDKDLDTPFGPVLFTPPYTRYSDRIGRITAFAPGTKENGAIFCHGAAFKMFADIMIGRGDEAYQTLVKILPSSPNKDIELYKAEPYIFPEYLVGKGNARYGEGTFTWLTGSVDWFFIAVTQGIVGVKPDFDGLRIEPCLPSSWPVASMVRSFRGARYLIEIDNKYGKSRKVKSINVDGAYISSNLIKPHSDGKLHRVRVTME